MCYGYNGDSNGSSEDKKNEGNSSIGKKCLTDSYPLSFLRKLSELSKENKSEYDYISEFMDLVKMYFETERMTIFFNAVGSGTGTVCYSRTAGSLECISTKSDAEKLSIFGDCPQEDTSVSPEYLYLKYSERLRKKSEKEYRSAAIFPFVKDNKVTGGIIIEKESGELFREDEKALLVIAADMVSLHLEYMKTVSEKKADDEFINALFEIASDHIFIKDMEHRFVKVNKSMLDFFGVSENEIIGKTAESIFSREYCEKLSDINDYVIGGEHNISEIKVKDNGKNSVFEVKHTPIYSSDNVITGLCGIARDITELKRTKLALLESEEQFKALVETAEDYIMIHDMEGNIEYLNPSGQKNAGYSLEEMKNFKVTDFLTPKSREDVIKRFNSRIEGFENKNIYEADFVNRRGEIASLEICSSLLKIEGKKDRVILIARDITQRKNAEKKLKESEERYALAFEGANDGLWDWDIKNKKLTVSARLKKLLGYDHAKIDTIEDFYRLTVPLNTPGLVRSIREHIRGKTDYYSQEAQLKDSTGNYRWFLIRGKAISDDKKAHLRMCGSLTDINSRKMMEQRLRKSELRYKSLLESQSDLIIRMDIRGVLTYVNEAFCSTFNVSRESAIGKSAFDFEYPENVQNDRSFLEKFIKDNSENIHYRNLENRVITRDGVKWFSWDCSAIRNAENRLTHIQAVGRNIDAIKNAQEEAIIANKTKSEFLASMSHEIRTPMNGILGMLKLLKKTRNEAERLEYIDLAVSSGERLLRLLNEILDLSKIEAKKMTLESEIFSIKEIIKNSVLAFRKQCREKGIGISYEIDDNLYGSYLGDSGRISQILYNLISNSYKFTEHGQIRISAVKFENQVESYLQERKSEFGFEKVLITVSDTGIGIPDENMDEIFQSFRQLNFNTKYSGSGLGLSIVKQLVNLMNGNISVKSDGNSGAEFSVLLPLKLNKIRVRKDSFALIYSDYFEEKYIEKAFRSNGISISLSISTDSFQSSDLKIPANTSILVCSDGNPGMVEKIVEKILSEGIKHEHIYILADGDDYPEIIPETLAGIKIILRPLNFDELLE